MTKVIHPETTARTSNGALRDNDKVQNVNSDSPYDLTILQWRLLASSFDSYLTLLKKLESLFTLGNCYYSEGATNLSICYRIHSTGAPAAKNSKKRRPNRDAQYLHTSSITTICFAFNTVVKSTPPSCFYHIRTDKGTVSSTELRHWCDQGVKTRLWELLEGDELQDAQSVPCT